LKLLVAEDGEALVAYQPEATTPIGELLAHEALNSADVVNLPAASLLVIDEAGPVGDSVEAKEGLTLLIRELFGGDGAGSEATLVLAALPDPGASQAQPV
jgi:hypothetical protein